MNVAEELEQHRDRIAGDNGWVWVQHMPVHANECCAVMFDTNILSERAHLLLEYQLRQLRHRIMKSVAWYNDHEATWGEMLQLFDDAINTARSSEYTHIPGLRSS